MSVRHLLVATAYALPELPGLAAPAAAHVLAQPTAVGALTAGRLWSVVAALLGLAGVVVGGRALLRAARRAGEGRTGAVVALLAGPAGAVGGGLVVAAADGGPGTGNGIVGGVVALGLGLLGAALGGLALARSRCSVRPAGRGPSAAGPQYPLVER